MSAAASWSYTSTATLWPYLGRNDRSGVESFGPPATFACDYAAKSQRKTSARGTEFVTQLQLYTERADIKQQDRVMLGDQTAQPDPIAAGASEVLLVERFADTFDQLADDFTVNT